jgi:hypothetical protein
LTFIGQQQEPSGPAGQVAITVAPPPPCPEGVPAAAMSRRASRNAAQEPVAVFFAAGPAK